MDTKADIAINSGRSIAAEVDECTPNFFPVSN